MNVVTSVLALLDRTSPIPRLLRTVPRLRAVPRLRTITRLLTVSRLLPVPGLRTVGGLPAEPRLRPGHHGVAVQPRGIRAGQHEREPIDPDLVPQRGGQRLVQGIRHLARDQYDQPAHELDQGERAVADDRGDDPGRDQQEEPEQNG
jgi:hypothetical protein